MDQVAKHTFTKMNQDISKSKFNPNIYYEGRNIRIITNEDFGSVTNEYGNELKLSLPDIESNPTVTKPQLTSLTYPLTNPTILGHSNTIVDSFYLLSKYQLSFDTAKLFYAQNQNVTPYIDSNIRIIIDGETYFENYDSTNGAVTGPSLPTDTTVRVQSFHLASEPNEAAPDPTLYLEVYENGELINKQSASLDYINPVTLFYDIVIDPNKVYFFNAYSLPEPDEVESPFSDILISDYIIDGDIFTIHKVNTDYTLELIFIDIIDIETVKLDVQGFYENESIIKLYWADGVNELRFINVADPDLLELNKNFIATVPNVLLSQPKITGFVSGGSSHTSGSIQYAYNLYKLNGAQTKISPLSNITYLNSTDRGNDIDVRVDKAPIISIQDLDTSFDRIRVYSIKYNSLNVTPEIKLIYEDNISTNLEIIDDNNSTFNTLSYDEFVFLGGETYYPKHLKIKDNHLFLLNYSTKDYDIDFDARAYRYDTSGDTVITNKTGTESYEFSANDIPDIPFNFDAINPSNKTWEGDADFNKYIWKTVSGSGGTTTNRTAFFNDVLELVSSNSVYEEAYYDEEDNEVLDSDPNIIYVTTKKETTSIYNLNDDLTYSSSTISGISNLISTALCNDSDINGPGNYEWQLTHNAGQITLYIAATTDSRCPTPISPTKVVELTVTESGDTYDMSFVMQTPLGIDENAVIQTSEFNADNFQIEETITAPIEGVLGGIGPNVEFEIKYKTVKSNFGEPSMNSTPNLASINIPSEHTSLKSGEIYRLYLEFQLEDGTFLFSKWIADVKIPEIGSEGSMPPFDADGNINYCYIETKLINLPDDERITGWRVTIVERTEFDRSVTHQGLYNAGINDNFNPSVDAFPSYLQRTIRNGNEIPTANNRYGKPVKQNGATGGARNIASNSRVNTSGGNLEITNEPNTYEVSQDVGFIYSPETVLNKSLPITSGRVRRLGLLENTWSESNRETYDTGGQLIFEHPNMPGDEELTKSSLKEGAELLLNYIGFGTNRPLHRAAKYGKLISDNRALEGEAIYSRKRHAYVRYFGGLKYLADTNSSYYDSIDSQIGFVQPIVNTFSIPNGSNNMSIAGRPGIPVVYPDDEITPISFLFYGGSATVVTGIANQVHYGTVELPANDDGDFGVLSELYRIVQNQYGGDTYTARQLNRTIPYSDVMELETGLATTGHQGDTFIQKFNYLKTFRANNGTVQIAEVVSFPVETTINLDLRFDISKGRGNNFEADENTYYGFNLAYNQKNNTIKGITKPFNFSEINTFPTNIIPSKIKINGELVDSFTDFLVNDIKTLDGQYDEITGVGEFKDNLYSFQKNAIAYLAINPRVQVQASDGIPIELGTGRLIERYQYITTNSGTLNKWSIVKSNSGLMYTDILTKSINFLAEDPMKITTVNGFYNKFLDYIDTYEDVLSIDNPVLNTGVITFYDKIKEDTYITFLTENPITIIYNGLSQGFTSFVDFFPRHYINADNTIITTNDNNSLWEHNKASPRSTYYDSYYPSDITLVVNDNPDINKIFNNIHFNSEFSYNNTDYSNITFNKLRVWNEYQDTELTDLNTLVYRSSIKRRLRKWNLIIPRDSNVLYKRDRISNYWTYVQLLFDKTELPVPNQLDYKFTLHDILISYTPKP